VLGRAAVVDGERAGDLTGRGRAGEALLLAGVAALAHERQELGDGREERARRDEAAVLLDDQAELVEAQTDAPEVLGHVDRGPAELARALPRLLGRASVLDDVAHQRGRTLALEHGANRVDQMLLLRCDLEIQGSPQPRAVMPSMWRAT
jgi:hypothetical protein